MSISHSIFKPRIIEGIPKGDPAVVMTPESKIQQTVFMVKEWEPDSEITAWAKKISERSGESIHWSHSYGGVDFFVSGRCDIEKISEAIKHFLPELNEKVNAYMKNRYSNPIKGGLPQDPRSYTVNITDKQVDYFKKEYLKNTPFAHAKSEHVIAPGAR